VQELEQERRRREEADREREDLRQQLNALKDERESTHTVEEEPESSEPHAASGGAQEGVQRPWWSRVFGG
jgi:hypothetical protein